MVSIASWWLEGVLGTAFPCLSPALHHAVVLPHHVPPGSELSAPFLLVGGLVPRHGDAHLGGPAPRGRQRRAAVLGAFPDGVPQPAEHVGPAVRQHVGLHGDTHLQRTPILLPEEVNVRRTCGLAEEVEGPQGMHVLGLVAEEGRQQGDLPVAVRPRAQGRPGASGGGR